MVTPASHNTHVYLLLLCRGDTQIVSITSGTNKLRGTSCYSACWVSVACPAHRHHLHHCCLPAVSAQLAAVAFRASVLVTTPCFRLFYFYFRYMVWKVTHYWYRALFDSLYIFLVMLHNLCLFEFAVNKTLLFLSSQLSRRTQSKYIIVSSSILKTNGMIWTPQLSSVNRKWISHQRASSR